MLVFAGINSSEKEQNEGKNEHLRSFNVKYPPRKKQKTEKSKQNEKGDWTFLGKRSLFRPATAAKKETYQRILRLSPSQKRESGSKRIGAIATGLASDSQVVVFSATSTTPETSDVISIIDLPDGAEAADLDIAEPAQSEFSLAYCTDYDIYEQTYKYDFGKKKTEKTPKGPRRIHQMPFPDTLESSGSRPKFRCLRFLNAQNIITLCNRPNKKGAELRIFHLYPTGPAILTQEKALPSRIKQAVAMDVCALDTDKDGNQQIAVAIAAQDISIDVYTTNYQRHTDTFSPFKSYLTLRNVHEHQMTKICFSPFHSPRQQPAQQVGRQSGKKGEKESTEAVANNPGPQYIHLASVSYGNTVVVDTFPLLALDPADKEPCYVLSHPSEEAWVKWAYILIASLIVLVIAFIVQSFIGGFGGGGSTGPFSLLPQNFRDFLDQPAAAAYGYQKEKRDSISSIASDSIPTNIPTAGRLQSLLSRHIPSPNSPQERQKVLVIRSAPSGIAGVTVDVHPDRVAYLEKDKGAKHWEELAEHQKAAWRERLVKAGEWVESEGEKVLVGCLFSEYAGLVREVVEEAIREL